MPKKAKGKKDKEAPYSDNPTPGHPGWKPQVRRDHLVHHLRNGNDQFLQPTIL